MDRWAGGRAGGRTDGAGQVRARKTDSQAAAILISQLAAYDIRKGITCSHLEVFGLSLVCSRVGRSLLQLSENGLILTLFLGPSWNNPDLTEL